MMKHYIKLGLWIFILSVLYAAGVTEFFGFCVKLPLIFTFVYGLCAKSFREKLTVSCICGVMLSALGGDLFVLSVLCAVYGTLIISAVFSGRLLKYSKFCSLLICIIIFVYEMILGGLSLGFELSALKGSIIAALMNLFFTVILYPIIRRSFIVKERYIF